MAAIKISMIRGDTRKINVVALDATGAALDLTGSTVYLTVNASQTPTDDTTAVLQKQTTTHTAPTLGLSSITLVNADTQNILPDTYFYDIQVKDVAGNVTSATASTFTITGDITRRLT